MMASDTTQIEKTDDFNDATTNEETAQKISQFVKKQLKKDLPVMRENDRKFSFYEIDLNDDGRKEFFVSLAGSYFCGSGGCSFYLLNDDLTINTYFSVTNPPIFVSSQLTNGWHDLIFKGNYDKDGGGVNFVHLKYSREERLSF